MTPMHLIGDRPVYDALDSEARNDQLRQLRTYMRQQVPTLLPGLANTLSGPMHVLLGQYRSVEDGLGFGGGSGDDSSNSKSGSFFAPMFSLLHPTDDDTPDDFWISPGYHHLHGLMPAKDAALLGATYRSALLDDRVRVNMHPFVAQNWHGSGGYSGIETAFGIGPEAGHSWGAIVVRYTSGSDEMMDHPSGFDTHADLAFSKHLSFTAGSQQNPDSDVGNYALLKWHAHFGN